MPTVVTTTIAATSSPTTPDYSTLQAWEDDLPANLVTADEQHIGECLDQGTFTGSLVIGGQTVDSTRNIILRCASGASFKDKAGVRTTALDFNTSNGVAVSKSDAYGPIVTLATQYTRIEGLQIRNSGNDGAIRFSTSDCRVDDCIIEGNIFAIREGATARNCLLIGRSTRAWQDAGSTSVAYGCTFIRRTNGGTTAFGNTYGGGTLKNCAVFNFATFSASTGGGFSATYCGTDLAAPTGTGNVGSLTYADQFESTTNDFRVKSGADLIGAGIADATNYPEDISGFTRVDPPTIGAWEYDAGGGGVSVPMAIFRKPMRFFRQMR